MYCHKCGAENRDDTEFCKKCGIKINVRKDNKKESKLRKVILIVLTVAVFIFSLIIHPVFTVIFLLIWIISYAHHRKKSSIVYCQKCGAENVYNAIYCQECGELIEIT